ncbi:hypothetical protein ACL6C3_09405 [Capilliphycus salinus ALCB114379]|uniref:hypothetical protein n=1 Tax=Capilliphycus salinus TaxID=2768948 RepID=UPI0039A63FF6
MIGKIFGFNKKSDYFLELDDAKATDSTQNQTAPEKSQPAPVEPKAKQEQPKPAAKTSKKTTTKAKAKAAPTEAKQEAKEQAKTTVEAISMPVQPKEPPSFNNGLESTPAGMTFSTDYLMKQPSSGRRRPGPSLNMFKDMARQVGRR